jgi:hypothetical protein
MKYLLTVILPAFVIGYLVAWLFDKFKNKSL